MTLPEEGLELPAEFSAAGPGDRAAPARVQHRTALGAGPGLQLELGLPEAVETGETLALDAAQRAADVGINIFVVELTEPTPGNTHLCMQPNSEFNLALAGGFGFGVTTDDPAELEEKLAKVAKKLPMRLVN